MDKTLVEKISYTEIVKNISQTQYEKIQEEYLLSKSPEKYMISMPVRVLMFESAEDKPEFTYYLYQEDNKDLFMTQSKRQDGLVTKTRCPLSKAEVHMMLDGKYDFLSAHEDPAYNSLYFQFTVNQLKPNYKKDCIRKVFHQNRFLDIIVDISIVRTSWDDGDFFTPSKLRAAKNNLRCHTRQYLNLSEPMSQLLHFEQTLQNSR